METSLPPREPTGVGILIPLELFAVVSTSVSDKSEDTEEEEEEEDEDDEDEEDAKEEVPDGDSFMTAGIVGAADPCASKKFCWGYTLFGLRLVRVLASLLGLNIFFALLFINLLIR